MIIEIVDISRDDRATGHALELPGEYTLGDIFDRDDKLRACRDCVVQATLNGARVDNWRELSPKKNDRVQLVIAPRGDLIAILVIVLSVISIIAFVVSLFTQPSAPKVDTGARESPTYGFDGIKTSFVPGNPVPVTYGQHRTGGQMLSMAIDVASGGKRQEMSLLLGLGEGPITSVNCVEINGVSIDEFGGEITIDTRVGSPVQDVITGFESIRNTFADGREFSDGAIVYTTQGNSVERIEVQVAFMNGLTRRGRQGELRNNAVRWSIEQKTSADSVYTVVDTRETIGATAAELWDTFDFAVTSGPDQYDVRLTWLTATDTNAAFHTWRIWLRNVTETINRTDTFSSTALLAVRAIATSQLQGGRPNVTALIQGKPVRVYDSVDSVSVEYSQNPAWCVLDYMTNSIYGMGPYMSLTKINLQSFVDFATLCNSQVPDGRGGSEDQHHLDIILDTRRPHWRHVQNLLTRYRSIPLFSQNQYKIVTDRADTPIRQVFHSGNMITGRTQIRIGGDPLRPNQANVEFANEALDYERDALYVQDSESVLGNGDAIKDFDMSLVGITRESEALREGSFHLKRRREIRREVEWETGLEALAVEPGDIAQVGVVMTDFGAGWGGRALDGSSSHIVLDREVTIGPSGSTYDLFVWHSATDTPEQRVVQNANVASLVTLTVSPTTGFDEIVAPGDRWAIGVQSQDLMQVRVKKVAREENGHHVIVGEQFVPIEVDTPSLVSTGSTFDLFAPPPQPISAVATEVPTILKDGNIVSKVYIDVSPAPKFMAGQLSDAGSTQSVVLADSHNPNDDALNRETLRLETGAASGETRLIVDWEGTNKRAIVSPGYATPPDSGDHYVVEKRNGGFAGFEVFQKTADDSDRVFAGRARGASIEIATVPQSDTVTYQLIPFSDKNVRNVVGPWELTLTTTGDAIAPPDPSSIYVTQGGGHNVAVHVVPTSVADLFTHNFYRNTSTNFSTSSLVGRGTEVYYDNDITVGQDYSYWAQAVDRSSNPSSVVGPATITVSGVDGADIVDLSVTAAQLAENAVITSKIASLAITAEKIATAAISAGHLAADAVSSIHLSDNAVGSAAINEATIGTAHIIDGNITNAKIGNAAVQSAQIANAAIGTAHIANASIVSATIANAAIGTAHIATAAVNTAQIADAAIINAKIDNLSVNNAKIANLTLTTSKIGANEITTDQAFTNDGLIALATGGAEIGSVTLTTRGGPVVILGSSRFGDGSVGDDMHEVTIKAGGTSSSTIVGLVELPPYDPSADYNHAALVTHHTPSGGTHEYTMWSTGNANTRASYRRLVAFELRR